MSIYSGFATRIQQQTYDQLTYQLINLLSAKILKNYRQQPTDELRFSKIIKQIFIKLSMMEKQKYLQPNLSNALYEIVQHYLQQQQPASIQLQNKKNPFWVKIQDKSEENFTQDTRKNQSRQMSSRKKSENFIIKRKATIINPQKTFYQKNKEKSIAFQTPFKNNKFNKTKKEGQIQRESATARKHNSMRHFEESRFHINIDAEQKSQQKHKCSHCHEQKIVLKKKSLRLKPNQSRIESISRRQIKTQRLIVPDLVKEYIEATNQAYMKNYRKRKVKFCQQYN